MSMLSRQIDKMRDKAQLFEGYQNGEISGLLREAADTIEGLRERLQDDVLRGECEIESTFWHDFGGQESDTYEFVLSCGHSVEWLRSDPPLHCPDCGAKVKAVKR